MKLEDILNLKWVGDKKLFEMATPRRVARRYISALGSPIVQQFLKLTYLNSPNDYRHWLHDGIDNYLLQIQEITLKEDLARPDPDTYYAWLFDDIYTLDESNIIARFRNLHLVRYENVPLRKEFNATEVLSDIQNLFNPKTGKILHDISAGRFKTILNYHTF